MAIRWVLIQESCLRVRTLIVFHSPHTLFPSRSPEGEATIMAITYMLLPHILILPQDGNLDFVCIVYFGVWLIRSKLSGQGERKPSKLNF